MTHDLQQMTNAELKQYISQHRNNEEAFRAALEVLMSRRDPNAPYQPYPFELTDPKTEVEALLIEKIKQAEQ
jgi:protein subunit release factor B